MVLARPNTQTMSPAEQQAYAIVEASFMQMLGLMMQQGVHPDRMLEPFMQKAAALYATVKIRGGKADLDDLINKFRRECAASIKQVIGDNGLPS